MKKNIIEKIKKIINPLVAIIVIFFIVFFTYGLFTIDVSQNRSVDLNIISNESDNAEVFYIQESISSDISDTEKLYDAQYTSESSVSENADYSPEGYDEYICSESDIVIDENNSYNGNENENLSPEIKTEGYQTETENNSEISESEENSECPSEYLSVDTQQSEEEKIISGPEAVRQFNKRYVTGGGFGCHYGISDSTSVFAQNITNYFSIGATGTVNLWDDGVTDVVINCSDFDTINFKIGLEDGITHNAKVRFFLDDFDGNPVQELELVPGDIPQEISIILRDATALKIQVENEASTEHSTVIFYDTVLINK